MSTNTNNKWASLGFVPSNNPPSSNNKWESLGFVPSNSPSPDQTPSQEAPVSQEQDYSDFQGEDSFGRQAARAGKNTAAALFGSPANLANSLYNAGAQAANSSGLGINLPLFPDASNMIRSSIDKATGGYTATPQDKKYLETAQDFSAETLVGGFASLLKKSPQLLKNFISMFGSTKGKDLVGAGVAGGVSQMSQDEGDGALESAVKGFLANLGASGAAKGAVNVAKNPQDAIKSIPGAIKSIPGAIKGGIAKATGYSPKNIDLNAVKVKDHLDVEMPNTALNQSTALALFEQQVQKAPYFGTKHNRKMQKIEDKLAQRINESFEEIGTPISSASTKGEVAHEVGKKSQEVLGDFSKSLKDESRQLYESAEALLPSDATYIPEKTLSAIKNLKERVSKSLSPTEDAKYILKTLNEIEGNLVLKSQFGDLKIPPKVEQLQATKISLNDKIDWDINARGSKNQLKGLKKAIDEDLAEYGKKNTEWYKAFKEADNFHGKYIGDKGISSETFQKIIAQENPEKILSSLNKVSDFQYIENVVGKTEEGKKFFNSLKREKFESLFEERIIDKSAINSTESQMSIKYNPLSKILDDTTKSTLLKYLIGDSNFQKVKDLQDYGKSMVGRGKRNPNASGTTTTANVVESLKKMIGGVAALLSGGGAYVAGAGALGTAAAAVAGPVIGAAALYKLVNSKKLLNYSINAAQAAKAGNIEKATKWGKLADKTALEVLGEKAFRELSILNDEDNSE